MTEVVREADGKYWVRVVTEWTTRKSVRNVAEVPVANASGAMKYQESVLDKIFQNYLLGSHDCVSSCPFRRENWGIVELWCVIDTAYGRSGSTTELC